MNTAATGSPAVRAAVVPTGTELLTGLVTDRNGPWLAERLGALGVEVVGLLCVGDRPSDLAAALRFLADQDVDLVITSGGLGPTADDLTAAVVAAFAGVELELDKQLEHTIASVVAGFTGRLRMDPDAVRIATRKQAMVPRGAEVLAPVGTAPGLVLPVAGGSTVIALPGPPRELAAMWPAAVRATAVRAVLDRAPPLHATHLRFFGLSESDIAATLREAGAELDLAPLEVVTCLRDFQLEVDLRHRPAAAGTAAALVARIEARHGRQLVSSDGSTLDEQLAGLLGGRRIGLAESCTGGLLAARLTTPAGASAYVAGGVVAYSNEAKVELLDVPAQLIEAHGAVSRPVAAAMADGALRRFGADVACAVTGIAGPGGGTETKPVGSVCFCAATTEGAVLAREVVLPGSRADIRDRSVVVAMHLLRRLLRDALGDPG